MALHFSVNVPSTSAVHVVVMCGRVSAIAFRVRITVKIGVSVCTTLTAMQSLHALGNLCVCAHGCTYLYNLFVFAYVWQAHLETASYAGLRNSRRKSLKLPLDFRS